MPWKKILKAILFPPLWLMLLLTPVAIVLVVNALAFLASDSILAIVSYVLAAYTLTVWCVQFPRLLYAFRAFKQENKFVRRWLEDDRLRVNFSLYSAFVLNVAYAAFHIGLGARHRTFWFYSLGIYYIFLAVMRFFLVRHSRMYKPGERMRAELRRYCACGYAFLLMNLALACIVFFMIYWNRTFVHHEITTITMAAYTFTAFTLAIVNIVKYRKYKSPVYSASKTISLAAACVSILTLEATMMTTFGGETMDAATRRLFLGLTGAAVIGTVVALAIFMIVQGTKKLRLLKAEENTDGE